MEQNFAAKVFAGVTALVAIGGAIWIMVYPSCSSKVSPPASSSVQLKRKLQHNARYLPPPTMHSAAEGGENRTQGNQQFEELSQRIQETLKNGGSVEEADIDALKSLLAKYEGAELLRMFTQLPGSVIYTKLDKELTTATSAVLKKVGPIKAMNYSTEIALALGMLSNLRTPDAVNLLFHTFSNYAEEPVSWPAVLSLAGKGKPVFQELAEFCIRNGDPKNMDAITQQILTSSGARQELLIRAMRVSSSYDDFDFLNQLIRAQTIPERNLEIEASMGTIAGQLVGQAMRLGNPSDPYSIEASLSVAERRSQQKETLAFADLALTQLEERGLNYTGHRDYYLETVAQAKRSEDKEK